MKGMIRLQIMEALKERDRTMLRYSPEPGVIFDTMQFLTINFSEIPFNTSSAQSALPASDGYFEIKEQMKKKQGALDMSLLPFCYSEHSGRSYLTDRLLTGDLSRQQLTFALNNLSYLRRSFTEYYFKEASTDILFRLLQPNGSACLEEIQKLTLPPDLKMALLYSMLQFEDAVSLLRETIWAVYSIVCAIQMDYVSRHPEWLNSLDQSSVQEKIACILEKSSKEPAVRRIKLPSCSLTLLEPFGLINKKNALLLGVNYLERLEREYAYLDVTPYTFAQALRNQTMNDIFQLLSEYGPLSAAEIGDRLHISHNSVAYNLKAMLDARAIAINRSTRLTFQYRINPDLLTTVAEQLIRIADHQTQSQDLNKP